MSVLPRTRVVHVRKAPFDVYIGRNFAEFYDGGWGNPYHIGPDGNREEVLVKYRAMIARNPALRAKIRKELAGKVLGCWCKPKTCHGDVLAEIANSCCDNEERTMDGGCKNCGDPCF